MVCSYKNRWAFSWFQEYSFNLFSTCCSYLLRLPQPVKQINLLTFGGKQKFWEKQKLFWEKQVAVNEVLLFKILSSNVHSYIDLFLHEISSSFEKQCPYQKPYHDLLGQKSVSFIWCIKAFKNLNGTKCFAEMDWKKFGKDQKPFATFLEIWQKIPAEEQNFQKRDDLNFIVTLYSFCLQSLVLQVSLSFPKEINLPFSQAEQLRKLSPSLDTLTIALVCIVSSNLSHGQKNQKNPIIMG